MCSPPPTKKCARVIYGVSITSNSRNFKYISSRGFADKLENLGCKYIWIFDYKPIGRGGGLRLELNDEQRVEFNDRVSSINKEYPFVIINTEKGAEVVGGCPAAKGTYFHINVDGSVSPCVSIKRGNDEVNLRNGSILDILDSQTFVQFRNIGVVKGCPSKLEPELFNEWIYDNEMKPISKTDHANG
uniref:Iron-sulfur cluster-binding domain-containing protein n=1 Tax=Candidatus Kentrum sp. DK TaxID=2126562 RepID=A0A450TQ70_9GAMM|nr:MAG: Iron-sulfur cluster-binding domain-containing protein [Candidatus Kentron sp. DK]